MGSRIKNIDNLKTAKPYMDKLEKIIANSSNKKFSSKNGALMNADGTKIILYPCAKTGSYMVIMAVWKA
ncbi:MAG: hypothetical protein HFH68_09810 [Lachnospiraceae bacterium]|nr:hypothetical protein [Lachnospiraceae bacterium]